MSSRLDHPRHVVRAVEGGAADSHGRYPGEDAALDKPSADRAAASLDPQLGGYLGRG